MKISNSVSLVFYLSSFLLESIGTCLALITWLLYGSSCSFIESIRMLPKAVLDTFSLSLFPSFKTFRLVFKNCLHFSTPEELWEKASFSFAPLGHWEHAEVANNLFNTMQFPLMVIRRRQCIIIESAIFESTHFPTVEVVTYYWVVLIFLFTSGRVIFRKNVKVVKKLSKMPK